MKQGTKVLINAYKPKYWKEPLTDVPGVILKVLTDPKIKKLGAMYLDPYIVEVRGRKVRFFEVELTEVKAAKKK